jgi:endoglucanase
LLVSNGRERQFSINNRPYRDLNNALVKGLYYQRCGCELPEQYAGPFSHKGCHLGKAKLINDDSVTLDVAGGWHDAGDYGRYIVPAAVTLGHMLYAYELFPEVFNDQLNILESGNGIPDILNECRYELEWMLKMQRCDGGVFHKVATRYFAKFVMPENDLEQLLLFPVSHCSTAGFSASLALASRIYRKYDKVFADRLLSASINAWEWLMRNPEFEPFKNPPNVNSGEYGDDNYLDELFWATCELYCTTRNKIYWETMQELVDIVDITQLGWAEVAGFGALNCLLINEDISCKQFIDKIRRRFLVGADGLLKLVEDSGYGTALSADNYIWGSILPILNNAIVLIIAKIITDEDRYQKAAQLQLNYLLGMNAMDISYVTGFGEKPFCFPHHRPSFADGVDEPVPGLVSGGPNKMSPDKATKEMIPPHTPPAKFYIDHTSSASSNEIAIYWNSPAIFVTSYFESLSL